MLSRYWKPQEITFYTTEYHADAILIISDIEAILGEIDTTMIFTADMKTFLSYIKAWTPGASSMDIIFIDRQIVAAARECGHARKYSFNDVIMLFGDIVATASRIAAARLMDTATDVASIDAWTLAC
jgi:hypothetical protein